MQLRYGLDDIPPLPELLLYGLQWLAISIPGIVIIGKVVAAAHYPDSWLQAVYLQKLVFMVGVVLLAQVLWGHRLPLVLGPSAVLLIGILASLGFGIAAISTSIMVGGLLLFISAATGLFGRLRRLFTVRVIAVVLLLIVFTLMPTVLGLIVPAGPVPPLQAIAFALLLVLGMFAARRYLPAIWMSSIIFWALLAGSLVWHLLYRAPAHGERPLHLPLLSTFFSGLTTDISVVPGVLIAFLFCFLGLAINDLGSIESVLGLLKPGDARGRINRGIALTGLGNVLSGFLGVIGFVNFSLSPGVIMSTGCASRFTLVPTGVLLVACSFSPVVLGIATRVPSVVIGAMLIYILTFQMAAGLSVIAGTEKDAMMETGIVVGLPVLVALVVSFLPPSVPATFPLVLRPILGNGFVMGVLMAFVLEHGFFRKTGRGTDVR